MLARLLPDAVRGADQRVQLVVGLVTRPRFHQAHVDRGVAAVGDDLQQDVIALFHTTRAVLNLVDARSQLRLVVAERITRFGRDELAMTPFHGWQFQVAAQVVLQHDIRDRPEHVDQLGDVDELAETLDRLVGAGRLQLQLRARVAEGARPGVELVDAALAQQALVLVANEREHLAHRVGDRRARGLDQRAARVDGLDEAALDVEVPCPLRTIRIDALQRRAISRKSQLSELLRLVHDHLVDAKLFDREHVVAALAQRLQLLPEALLHGLQALAGDTIVAIGARDQRLEGRDLRLDHAPLEVGRHGDELERGVGDDDGVPARGRGTAQEARPLLLGEVGLVRDQDAGGWIQLEELATGLCQAVSWYDQHCLAHEAQASFLHDGCGDGEGLAAADRVGDVG